MGSQQLLQEEGIDLSTYIKAIIKRKRFILFFFLIVVVAAAISSINAPKAAYKAIATIIITLSTLESTQISSNVSPLSVSIAQEVNLLRSKLVLERIINVSPLSISIAKHVNLLKSRLVLERTIQQLILNGRLDKNVSIEDLSSKLNAKDALGSNVIQLEAIDVDPQRARDMANAWAEQYKGYSQELALFEVSQRNLLAAEEKVNDHRERFSILRNDPGLVQLIHQVDILKGPHDILLNKILDTHALKEAGQGGEVRILSSASIPKYPVSQGQREIVTLAGVFSLTLSMFLVFFIEFWNKGNPGDLNNEEILGIGAVRA